jgi:hypothetical protein
MQNDGPKTCSETGYMGIIRVNTVKKIVRKWQEICEECLKTTFPSCCFNINHGAVDVRDVWNCWRPRA